MFARLKIEKIERVGWVVDGDRVEARAGETVLSALLAARGYVRHEGTNPRAGFCFMAACQDCWIWDEQGNRVRACSTVVKDGLAVVTSLPEADHASR